MVSAEIAGIALRSIIISGSATLLAASWSIPAAYVLAKRNSRRAAAVLEGLVGVPTVIIGLMLYMFLCSRCPLGFLGLLYTPYAIILGEAVLITPLVTGVSYRVLASAWRSYGELALTLGADEASAMMLVVGEAWPGVAASLAMGFSRAIGELGVALILGGNIRGYTRVLTTAIALEVSRGRFEEALALGAILVAVSVAVSVSVRVLRGVAGRWL